MFKATGSRIVDETLTTLKIIGNQEITGSDSASGGALQVNGGALFKQNVLIDGNLYINGTAFIPGTNATELQGYHINPMAPSPNEVLTYSGSDWRPESNLTLGNLTLTGNLVVEGSHTTINSTTVTTVDNVILINSGELGNGVTSTYNSAHTLPGAGIEIDRGTAIDYQIVFDETYKVLKVGFKDTPLATVVTSQNNLVTNGVTYWDGNYIANDASMTYSSGVLTVPKIQASDRVIARIISSTDYLYLHSEVGVVIGSSDNTISATGGIVAGKTNTASGNYSTALGGRGNTASANYSTVLGGNSDLASGLYSIAGGQNSAAIMNNTIALGNNAVANTPGSFVYSDNSGRATYPSDSNQFVVRGSGGTLLFSHGSQDTSGVQILPSDSTIRTLTGAYIDTNAVSIQGYPVSGNTPVLGQGLIFDGTTWTPSDITSGSGNATSIQGRALTSDTYNANTNDVLVFNGSQWSSNNSVVLNTGSFSGNVNADKFIAQPGNDGHYYAPLFTFYGSTGSGMYINTNGNGPGLCLSSNGNNGIQIDKNQNVLFSNVNNLLQFTPGGGLGVAEITQANTTAIQTTISQILFQDTSSGPMITQSKSNSGVYGVYTQGTFGDAYGGFQWYGVSGNDASVPPGHFHTVPSVTISSLLDPTAGSGINYTGYTQGAVSFQTQDGSGSLNQAMYINYNQQVVVGNSIVSQDTLTVYGGGYFTSDITAGNISVAGATFTSDVIIYGNLTVQGSQTIVNTTDLYVQDNVILLNYGETGSGVSRGFAGIVVDRGTATDYRFIFQESSQSFRIGIQGLEQSVATREDTPVSYGIPFWNAATDRFDTSSTLTFNGSLSVNVSATFSSDLKITGVSDQIVLGSGTTSTISAITPASSRVYTIQDPGANATFAMATNTPTTGYTLTATTSSGSGNPTWQPALTAWGALPGSAGNLPTASQFYVTPVSNFVMPKNGNLVSVSGYYPSITHGNIGIGVSINGVRQTQQIVLNSGNTQGALTFTGSGYSFTSDQLVSIYTDTSDTLSPVGPSTILSVCMFYNITSL